MKVLILVTVLIGVILMIPEGLSQSDLPELEGIEASADQMYNSFSIFVFQTIKHSFHFKQQIG